MGRPVTQQRRIAQVQTDDRNMNQLQTNISAALAPMLTNPLLSGQILSNVALMAGPNLVNHGLGRKLIGWTLVRQRQMADIWDAQDSNTQPALTLALVASANATCDIYVF